MSSLTVCRTETQLSTTAGIFTAMDNLMTSSVSSSFVVPSNVGAIRTVEIAVTADAAEEFVPLIRLSGNGMSQEQFVSGAAVVNSGSATGTASNYVMKETDFTVTPGNSIEIAMGATASITGDASVVLTFA